MTGDGGMCPVTGADFTGESVHVPRTEAVAIFLG